MRQLWISMLAAGTVAFWAAALPAQEEKKGDTPARDRAQGIFQRLDKNGDGKVTADEVPEGRKAFFERLVRSGDKDGDGALSREEFAAALRRRPQESDRPRRPEADRRRPGRLQAPAGPAFFRLLDANKNGKLESEELAKAAEVLKELDRDGDGALSLREVLGGRPQLAAPGRPAAGAPPARAVEGLFRRFDKNGDGKLTRDEVRGRLARNFEKADANGDGAIDRHEAAKLIRIERPQRPKPEGKAKKSDKSKEKKKAEEKDGEGKTKVF